MASEEFVHAHGLENQAIEIVGQAMTTDDPSTFESRSAMNLVGYNMTKDCAAKAFSQAGFGPGEGRDQVGVVELHDCFAANEVRFMLSRCVSPGAYAYLGRIQLVTYEALGLCAPGEAHKMVDRGDNTVCTSLNALLIQH